MSEKKWGNPNSHILPLEVLADEKRKSIKMTVSLRGESDMKRDILQEKMDALTKFVENGLLSKALFRGYLEMLEKEAA